MKALQYNSGTSTVMQLLETLGDFVFFTNPDNVVTQSSAALGFPSGATVGAPI